jgi:rhamnogalacturonan endolyase
MDEKSSNHWKTAGRRYTAGMRVWILIGTALGLAAAGSGRAEMRFEAEDVTPPAWRTNEHSDAAWNLWSTDQDAAAKWSGGVVLQSPVVHADRGAPEDGAPPLRARVAGLSNGLYDVSLRTVRDIGVSLDGRSWRRFGGGALAESHAVTNGVFEVWVDDRYATTGNIGACYFDYIEFSPLAPPPPRPRVEGPARERVEERLDRGLVALPAPDGIYAGWRLLRSDPPDTAFHVYRAEGDGKPVRLSDAPVRTTTDFVDAAAPFDTDLVYTVRRVADGHEDPPQGEVRTRLPRDGERPGCLTIKLNNLARFQKCGVGDLDGDGRYDFVIKQPDDSIDPYVEYWRPSPDTYKLEAYSSDGRFLWRKDLGWAIERGIWYSPFIVHDLDGDGRAEVAAKIGEGDPRDDDGYVRTGPEWVAVWDGMTGREIARAPWPGRDGLGDGLRGYNYASRNQLAVAYLDGRTPCLILLRGTYTVMKADAYALDEGGLRLLWSYRSDGLGRRYQGQGAHFTHCADVDGDGRDEIVLGSAVLDDTGAPLWSTGLGHPDHCYVGDLMPWRPGLEIYYGLETARPRDGMCMADAATGRLLWGWDGPTRHIHSTGLCADICPRHPGVETYGADSVSHKPTGDRWLWSAKGEVLSRETDFGFARHPAYWDADLQRELIDGGRIFDFEGGALDPPIEGKSTVLVADILGDWREELIVTEKGELRIYTTTSPAMDRRVTLMQDPIYRRDVAMCAMGYTQSPTLSVDLESLAPNLNLTALAGRTDMVQVVASAPRGAALRGEIRLSAIGASLTPSSLPVSLAPGERRVWECAVARNADAPPIVRVEAALTHAEGVLRGRATCR